MSNTEEEEMLGYLEDTNHSLNEFLIYCMETTD